MSRTPTVVLEWKHIVYSTHNILLHFSLLKRQSSLMSMHDQGYVIIQTQLAHAEASRKV